MKKILTAGFTTALMLSSISTFAADLNLNSLTELVKDAARISTSTPVANNTATHEIATDSKAVYAQSQNVAAEARTKNNTSKEPYREDFDDYSIYHVPKSYGDNPAPDINNLNRQRKKIGLRPITDRRNVKVVNDLP